jgi:hypothetical protein
MSDLLDLREAIFDAEDWTRTAANWADELVGWDYQEHPDGRRTRVPGSGWPEMAYLAEQLERICQMFHELVPTGIKDAFCAAQEEEDYWADQADANSL